MFSVQFLDIMIVRVLTIPRRTVRCLVNKIAGGKYPADPMMKIVTASFHLSVVMNLPSQMSGTQTVISVE